MARILVTGATGYLGGRLVPALLDAGHSVRCLARSPEKLDAAPWRAGVDVDVLRGDVSDPASLDAALEGIDAAYYLVHSIGGGPGWRDADRRAAANFRDAATKAGVRQIVYLGGLGDERADLSEHLASRQEVGDELRAGPVPVTELRAAVVIGSGSASFEMLRHLVEKLPAMVTPRWVHTRCQPIAVRDVLAYLVGVLGNDAAKGRVLEIGGADVVTYLDMMRTYAEVAGLHRRVVVPVPVLSPRLSSLWIGLVTPLPPSLGRPLVDSLVNDVVVRDDAIREIVPHEPLAFREAVEAALRRVDDLDVRAGTGAGAVPTPADPQPTDPDWSGGTVLEDRREVESGAPPEALFAAVSGIGGDRGWYSASWLWTVRGVLDLLLGGVGPRRGRRDPDRLAVGDAVDAWRVEAMEPGRLLRLRSEMRMPGRAWLEWTVAVRAGGGSLLVQRARFAPRGLLGRAYWYLLVPLHALMFRRMAHRLATAAEAAEAP